MISSSVIKDKPRAQIITKNETIYRNLSNKK